MEKMKIRIKNEEHSKRIQEKLFEMGCFWNYISHGYWSKRSEVQYTQEPFLFVENDGSILHGSNVKYFEALEQQDYQEYVFKNGEFQKVGQQVIIQDPENFTDEEASQILTRAKDKLSSPSAQLIYLVEEMLRSHKDLFTHHFES